MIEFETVSDIPARHVACRLSMIAGISGPLAWEPLDRYAPAYPTETKKDVWDLGAGFTLNVLGEHNGSRTYRLIHPELTHTLRDLQSFLEWVFDNMAASRKSPCCDPKES